MKNGDVIKAVPPSEVQKMTYYDRELNLEYVITQVISNLTYKLYVKVPEGLRLLKTRKNDPLFKEVI